MHPEYPDPCIYTAIRDPISHFLSGYNEIEWRVKRRASRQKIPLTTADLRRKRFQAFVEDLVLGQIPYDYDTVFKHIQSMSRILVFLQNHNATLTGVLPQLTNLTSTFPPFLSKTCTNMYPAESMPPLHKGGQHSSSNDPLGTYQAAKDVWKEAGPTARALCLLHAFDYACFPELPDGVPPLCQSVYKEHADEIIQV